MYMIECERIQQEMMQKTDQLVAPPEDNVDLDGVGLGGDDEDGDDGDEEQLINYEIDVDEEAFGIESKQHAEKGGDESDDDDKVPASGEIVNEEDSDMDEDDLKPPGE